MFIARLRNLSFKQNISDTENLLQDQKSSYAVLRYAHDIPTSIFNSAMDFLTQHLDMITERKLLQLVDDYIKATKAVSFEFTDEFDYSIDLIINKEEPFGDCEVMYDFEED